MTVRSAALLLTICSLLSTVSAQTSHPALTTEQTHTIDAIVAAEMAKQQIPGLQVGVYGRGVVLLAKGYGLADVELSAPVKPETLFQSGSVGKQFVSASIMMLVEKHKLSLDDSITEFFPDAPPSWKPILTRNMLSHTSGLAEYETPERSGPKGPFYLRLDFTEDELVQKIEALPIDFAPGEQWAYRNTNYVLLGILIHKLTGMPYADFLAVRIFKPLAMNSTRLISDADIIPNRSSGYEIAEGKLRNQAWVSPTFNSTADGTLYFNVLDLAKWDEALYTTKLLSQSSLDRIWTVYLLNSGKPNPAHYGFAWGIDQRNGHRVISHGGAWQGFTPDISRYPDDSLTVVVLANLDAGHARPGLIGQLIAGSIIPSLSPAKFSAIPDSDPALAASLSKLLTRLANGEDIRDQTAPDLTAQMPPGRMKGIQGFLSTIWPGGTLTLVQRQTGDGPTLSVYRLTKPGGNTRLIYYALDSQGKVSAFGTAPDREYQ